MMDSLGQPWKRVKAWSGWTGVGVTACLLLVACLVLGLGQNRERFGDGKSVSELRPQDSEASALDKESFVSARLGRKLPPRVEPTMPSVSPSGMLACVAIEEAKGRRYFRIRAVAGGPDVLIDADTGRLIEDTAVRVSSGGGGGDGPHTPKGALSVVPTLPMIPTLDIERD